MKTKALKKIIAMVIVATLIVAVFPAMPVFAEETEVAMSGVRIEYPTCAKNSGQTSTTFEGTEPLPGCISYKNSSGRIEWLPSTASSLSWNRGAISIQAGQVGQYGAYKIRVPNAGKYNGTVQYRIRPGSATGKMYILPISEKDNIANAIKNEQAKVTVAFSDGTTDQGGAAAFNNAEFEWEAPSAGEYIVVWVAETVGAMRPANIILDGCGDEKVDALVGEITLSDTELVAGDNATITSALYNGYTGAVITEAVTYTSSDASVLSVEGASVTAEKAGNATLYAEVAGYPNKVALEVNVAEANAPVELTENVNFASGAAIEYKIGEGEYTSLSANDVKSIPVGAKITVKVNDDDNFAGWVRGTENSKNWISDESEYTFTIMSHTYLTPIYTETKATDAEQVVEFWNENKEYLGTSDVVDGKATAPVATLTGHSFSAWHISVEDILPLESGSVNVFGIADAIIRAVAKHNAANGFGTTIQNSNAAATYWKRGEDIVAYGSSYDFYKWSGDEDITFGTETVENKPLVVLDTTSVDGAYMIEYDKGDATEIVEAGILFGSDADIVIGSTDGSKAVSQRNDNHGQFCAKPNTESSCDYVRGYLIYRADNKLYVIYTNALTTVQ